MESSDKHLNDMIVKYWLLHNLIDMYNDVDANIRHPNANKLAKMVIKDIKNTYIDDQQANEIWNKYIEEGSTMVRNYLVIARVDIDFDGWYGATEDYILGHSQSKMVADSYAATLTRELELYKEGKEDSEIITDYRFLWAKDIINTDAFESYKHADEVIVKFVVVETENIDSLEVCDIREANEDGFEQGIRAAMDIIDKAGLEADYDTLTVNSVN